MIKRKEKSIIGNVIDNFLWSQKRVSTYFGITTKSEYLLASDIALQCMYIQFNACIQFIAFQACIFSSMHVFNPMHGQFIQFNACILGRVK